MMGKWRDFWFFGRFRDLDQSFKAGYFFTVCLFFADVCANEGDDEVWVEQAGGGGGTR